MERPLPIRVGFAILLLALTDFWQQGSAFPAGAAEKRDFLSLQSPAPDFKLTDVVSGQPIARDDFSGKKALLVIFICRSCPYVQRVKEGLAQLGRDYAAKDIGIVAIGSNDPSTYPEDSPEKLKDMAKQEGFLFPVLFDASQEVAKSFTAVATPEFFLFDQNRLLVYRGQFDEARPGNGVPVTGEDVRVAIDAVLEDRPVPEDQKPAIGCTIKWKPGHAPAYTG